MGDLKHCAETIFHLRCRKIIVLSLFEPSRLRAELDVTRGGLYMEASTTETQLAPRILYFEPIRYVLFNNEDIATRPIPLHHPVNLVRACIIWAPLSLAGFDA